MDTSAEASGFLLAQVWDYTRRDRMTRLAGFTCSSYLFELPPLGPEGIVHGDLLHGSFNTHSRGASWGATGISDQCYYLPYCRLQEVTSSSDKENTEDTADSPATGELSISVTCNTPR